MVNLLGKHDYKKKKLKTSGLGFFGINYFNNLNVENLNEKEPVNQTDNSSDQRIRVIAYNIFNGGIGYKGINGHELPEGPDSRFVRKAREMGQIPKRIMLELFLYNPDIISFSESAKDFDVENMAKSINFNHVHFYGGKDGLGKFPGSILTRYEIVH